MDKTYSRDIEQAARVQKTARITGYKTDTVRKVITDVRKNDLILNTYMELQESEEYMENKLIEAIKELVPLPSKSRLNSPQKS